jgi:cathepsin F
MHKLLIVTLLALCVNALAWKLPRPRTVQETAFQQYIRDYNKSYKNLAEYNKRLGNFKNNLLDIADLNRKHPLATFAVNKFSDMSPSEFKDKYLMRSFDPADACLWPYHRMAKIVRTQIPSSFDWRNQKNNPVSPVKNQQECGSCWTFSTAENIEGQWALAGHWPVPSLSEQWIVDCSHGCLQSEPDLCNSGCGGGLPWLAYEDIINNKGLTGESNDPYTGEQGTCPSGDPIVATISNWTALDTDATDIITYMVAKGPLSITLNAALLMSYSGGVITGSTDDCPNSGSDHAVLLVGYDNTQSPPYWIVKNSWGTDWGENGYFRIESDNQLCGINSCVTSAIV